jgi:hypothetical protein
MFKAEQQDINACLSLTWCAVRSTDSTQHVGYLQSLFRMTSFSMKDLEPHLSVVVPSGLDLCYYIHVFITVTQMSIFVP